MRAILKVEYDIEIYEVHGDGTDEKEGKEAVQLLLDTDTSRLGNSGSSRTVAGKFRIFLQEMVTDENAAIFVVKVAKITGKIE